MQPIEQEQTEGTEAAGRSAEFIPPALRQINPFTPAYFKEQKNC